MFLESIKVIETSPCLADEEKFKAITRATINMNELLPYLNSVVDKPNYQPNSHSLMFKKGIVGFTIQNDQINVTRFINMTELYELLDWIKDLINDVYDSKDDIEPNHKAKKIIPVLTIYNLLPKTNCKECGENSCMAFATRINKLDAEIEDCPVLNKEEFVNFKKKLYKLVQS